jgi:hypothetical protein
MINRVAIVFLLLFAKFILAQNYQRHTVAKGETIIQIAQRYNCTPYDIFQLNPNLQTSLQPNTILLIPHKDTTKKSIVPTKSDTKETKLLNTVAVKAPNPTKISDTLGPNSPFAKVKKEYQSLSPNQTTSIKKKLVLLLPFNLPKVEGDSLNSITSRLKKDKFLNLTLDFYSGALMAIDSAKVIGLPVEVSIYDSQETKNSSAILAIHQSNGLDTADAIIGPFYQNNVEKTAALFVNSNVPVISPLSKDLGNTFPNLYQTIPTAESLKKAVFDYMIAQEGNIIAVIDKKKESARQFMKQNYSQVQYAPLLENGNLSVDGFKSLLQKNTMNYVVLATENTGMIKWTMSTMMSLFANYRLQLVIMEPNETLDTDEISFENLTKLKLLYPSIARDNDNFNAKIFKKEYRKKNKVYPNTYATRGFDLTFDTLMRLVQDKTYAETVDSFATEQVDNKFEFYQKEDGGYTNKGIYILYYDTDLTIKEAN